MIRPRASSLLQLTLAAVVVAALAFLNFQLGRARDLIAADQAERISRRAVIDAEARRAQAERNRMLLILDRLLERNKP